MGVGLRVCVTRAEEGATGFRKALRSSLRRAVISRKRKEVVVVLVKWQGLRVQSVGFD
jgi:hypothetical protein